MKVTLTVDLSPELLPSLFTLLSGAEVTAPSVKQTMPAAIQPVIPFKEITETSPCTEPATAGTETPTAAEAPKTTAAKKSVTEAAKTAVTVNAAELKTNVRAAATVLAKAGKQETLKEIFAKYNAAKLTDVAVSDYPALLKELEDANG